MLSLDNPKVQAVRERFDSPKRGHKSNLKFDTIYEKISNLELSIKQIAKELNITTQGLLYLYKKYFQKLLPKNMQSAQSRRKLVSSTARLKKANQILALEGDSPATIVWNKLKSRRISCQRIETIHDGYARRSLIVRGELCYISHRERSHKYSPHSERKHFHFTIGMTALIKAKYIIFVANGINRQDFYIIPREVFSPDCSKSQHHFVPDVTTPRKTRFRKQIQAIDYDLYLNNWDILKEPD